MSNATKSRQAVGYWRWVIGALALCLLAFHATFGRFFDPAGVMGDDYSYFLPALLEGVYWQSVNGWFAVPWFSPAQCAGLPAFPNPQNLYFSLPQLLTVYLGPTLAVYLTILLFAAIGFLGMVAYVRLLIGPRLWPALIAGTLFLFCGMMVQRSLVGHFTFHLYYLVPLIAWLLARPGRSQVTHAGTLLAVGALFAYMVYAGGAVLLPAAILTIVVLGLMLGAAKNAIVPFMLRLAGAGILGITMSAAKLVATLAWMGHFPRDLYAKPGFSELGELAEMLGRALFFRFPEARLNALIDNTRISYSEHSTAMSLTPLPLVIVALWLLLLVTNRLPASPQGWKVRTRWPIAAAILLALLCVALNYHAPAWSAWLASLPYLRNSSNYFPFLFVLIMLLLVTTTLLLDRVLPTRRLPKRLLGAALLLAIPGYNALQDWSVYEAQRYRPQAIELAYQRLQEGQQPPQIRQIASYLDNRRQAAFALNGNELFTRGGSNLLCYEPLFGYRLEGYPFADLRLGPVHTQLSGGRLNMKNPACMLYPDVNQCQPGEHFRLSEAEQLQQFLHYQPFQFAVPWWQRLANGVSMLALIGALLLAIGLLWRAIPGLQRIKGRR